MVGKNFRYVFHYILWGLTSDFSKSHMMINERLKYLCKSFQLLKRWSAVMKSPINKKKIKEKQAIFYMKGIKSFLLL